MLQQAGVDSHIGTPVFGGKALPAAGHETGQNLLSDAQEPTVGGQPAAKPSDSARPDQSTVPNAVESGQSAEANQIRDMLAHAKQVNAYVVKPGEVIKIDDLDFTRQPAWNPHPIQKSPVDTIDDLIIDKQGNLSINSNKEASKDGTVSIGIQADEVHWSPFYLPAQQQDTIRDTISYVRANNPEAVLPVQLKDIPWTCIETGPQQQVQPAVDPAMFQKLLDMHKLTDRIVAAVAGNEGNLTTVTTNDAGFGWSIGMRQWNQHVGELPLLLGAMYQKDPCKFVKDFGPYAGKMINNAGDPLHATVNQSFIRHADFSALLGFKDSRHKSVNHVQDVEKALSDFQDVQVALSRQWVDGGVRLAKKYGFKSELGWAEVCDVVNQKGAGSAERTLKLIPSAAKDSEAARIKALENAAHRPGGQERLANLQRKFSAKTTAVQ